MAQIQPVADQYGLGRAYEWDRSYKDLPNSLSHPLATKAATSLADNFERCFALAISLPMTAMWAALGQEWQAEAVFNVTGKVALDIPTCPQETYDAIVKERDRIESLVADMWIANRDEMERKAWADSVRRISQGLGTEAQREEFKFVHEMTRANLLSVAVMLWTAVEVFTADLWLSVVNDGPKRFAENVLGGAKLMEDSELSKEQQAQISFKLLKKYDYDLTHTLGDVLAEAKRVNFRSLKDAAKAYSVAFGRGANNVFDETTQSYANVMVLYAIRNVIVHKAGQVDRDYQAKVGMAKGSSLSSLRRLAIGDTVPIHGDWLKPMEESAIRFCESLVSFVDAELVEAAK
jgi:hypothetical protein